MTRILVAEDDVDIARLLDMVLSVEGYEVEVVGTGVDLLERLHQQAFDLLVSDDKMPGLSGSDALRQIRADEDLHDLPAILVSAHAKEVEAKQPLEAAAQAYLEKPFEIDELLDMVRQLVA